jgi:hypothetical protein
MNSFKSIVTPSTALSVFIFVLVLALLISGFCNPRHFEHTRTKIFLYSMAALGVFITFLFYYSIVTLQQSQQRLAILEVTSDITNFLTKGVLEQACCASTKIPHFTMSLFPLLKKECKEDNDTEEHILLKHKLAYKIFSMWQELLLAIPFIDIEPTSYLCICLQKANSRQLYDQWLLSKCDFNTKTQQFGDLLFKYAKHLKPTTKAYCQASKKLLQNVQLKQILYN